MTNSSEIQILKRGGKAGLAYVYTPAQGDGHSLPLVMFCGGYRSDMAGTKAIYFEEQCVARGQAYLRFDYSGHGDSEGTFEDGTIGSWFEDACDVLDHVAKDNVLVVGSSMGGWIAMLLADARAGMVQGLIGIAAAPDFTEEMFTSRLNADQQKELMDKGVVAVENDYSDEPYHFTREFYEDAKKHLLLGAMRNVDFPIRLFQGMKDKDVSWETAVKIQKNYTGSDVDVIFVDDGDHRLSRPEDLELINREIESLSSAIQFG